MIRLPLMSTMQDGRGLVRPEMVQQALEQAAQAQAQAGDAQHRAEMARDEARAMRDFVRSMERQRPGVVVMPPGFPRALSRRQEGMLFVGTLFFIMAAAGVLYPLFRAIGRRIERAPRKDDLASAASAQRLERIEQAVEAMAIEIERISEGQRFTTRLLSSRMGEALPLERQLGGPAR